MKHSRDHVIMHIIITYHFDSMRPTIVDTTHVCKDDNRPSQNSLKYIHTKKCEDT